MNLRIYALVAVACIAIQPAFAVSVWFSAGPSSVASGQSYYVEATCSAGGSNMADVTVYKNSGYFAYNWGYGSASAGGSTTDNGAQTVEYFADGWDWTWEQYSFAYKYVTVTATNNPPTITWTQAPANVPVNEWFYIEARGNDSDGNLTNVFVWREWSPHAFTDGGNGYEKHSGNASYGSSVGTVTFMAQSRDSNDAYSPVIYHTVTVYQPNIAPTIQWADSPPTSVYVNQYFTIRARANDANGNLTWINVWKNDAPFAFNGGGNGWEAYSDNNGTSGSVPGTITFKAKAGDGSGAETGFIYHNVNVVNRSPSAMSLDLSGTTVEWSSANGHYTAWTDNAITATATLQDPDGNLVNHTLRYQKVTGAGPVEGSWIQLGNSTPSNGANSTKQSTLPTLTPGRWDFNSFGHDGYASHGGVSKTIWVYGPTNGGQFIGQSVSTSAMEIGSTRSVSVTFKNSGDKPWSIDGSPHQLGNVSASVPNNWTLTRIGLNTGEVIVPGGQKTFTFTITAPATPGDYNFQWRMVEDGLEWFGESSPNVVISVVDSTAPTVPTNLQVVAKTHNTISLSWSASTDNSGQAPSYQIYRNDVPVGTAPGPSFVDSNLTHNTTYNYTVRAYDGANNLSGPSNTVEATTEVDPNADDDGDGASNAVEQQLGTNPNVSNQSDANNAAALKVHRPKQ